MKRNSILNGACGILLLVVGSALATAGLIADPLVPAHLEPFAAGFAFAGIVELCAGLLIYVCAKP